MPLSCHCPSAAQTAQSGGYLSSAPGVSTVRYPIPERIFDYSFHASERDGRNVP